MTTVNTRSVVSNASQVNIHKIHNIQYTSIHTSTGFRSTLPPIEKHPRGSSLPLCHLKSQSSARNRVQNTSLHSFNRFTFNTCFVFVLIECDKKKSILYTISCSEFKFIIFFSLRKKKDFKMCIGILLIVSR